MEYIKQTIEMRVETENEAKEIIDEYKNKALENGYEISSYSTTHKMKKDDDFYILKIVKTW